MCKIKTNPGSTQVCIYTTFFQTNTGLTRVEPTSGGGLDLTRVEPGLVLTLVEPGLVLTLVEPGLVCAV